MTLCAAFLEQLRVLSAPDKVVYAICNLARDVGECCKFHYSYFCEPPLYEKKVTTASCIVKAAPNIQKQAASIAFKAATGLTMGAGFERVKSMVNMPMLEKDSHTFASITLNQVRDDVIIKGGMVASAAAHAFSNGNQGASQELANLANSIDRSCSALCAIIASCDALGSDGKMVLKKNLEPAVEPALCCLKVYSPLALSSAATSAINTAAASVFRFFLSILRTLSKELGVEFKILIVTNLIEGLASIASPATQLTQSQIAVVVMLNRTLRAIFCDRAPGLSGMVESALSLIVTKVAPICKCNSDNAVVLMPSLLGCAHTILLCQWKALTVAVAEASNGGSGDPGNGGTGLRVGIKVGGLPAASHPLFASGAAAARKKTSIKPEFSSHFEALCSLFLFCVQAEGMNPSVVSMSVKLLLNLGRKVTLFRLSHFKERMGGTFIAAILEDLLKLNQPLLVDDLNMLLFEMVSADFGHFFAVILPQIVDGMSIAAQSKVEILQTWGREEDCVSFRQNCENFLGEFRYISKIKN